MGMTVVTRQDGAIYERRWQTRGDVTGAMTIDALIETLEGAAEELRTMAAAGVSVERVTRDHAILITRDPTVAKTYGFWRREDDPGVSVSDRDRGAPDVAGAQGEGDRQWRARVTCARP
jgi:hypothetical protein